MSAWVARFRNPGQHFRQGLHRNETFLRRHRNIPREGDGKKNTGAALHSHAMRTACCYTSPFCTTPSWSFFPWLLPSPDSGLGCCTSDRRMCTFAGPAPSVGRSVFYLLPSRLSSALLAFFCSFLTFLVPPWRCQSLLPAPFFCAPRTIAKRTVDAVVASGFRSKKHARSNSTTKAGTESTIYGATLPTTSGCLLFCVFVCFLFVCVCGRTRARMHRTCVCFGVCRCVNAHGCCMQTCMHACMHVADACMRACVRACVPV
jgi:hypothetical protein